MDQDYKEFSTKIIKLVGGKDNISDVFHCATRLRFSLKDISKAESNIDDIKLQNILRLVVKKSPTGVSTHCFFFMLK